MRRLIVEKVGETSTGHIYRITEQTHRCVDFAPFGVGKSFECGGVTLRSDAYPEVSITKDARFIFVNVRGERKYNDDYLLKIPLAWESRFLAAVKAYNEAGLKEAMGLKVECGTVYAPIRGGRSLYLVSQTVPCPERCNRTEWMLMDAATHNVAYCFPSDSKVHEFLVGRDYHAVGKMRAEMFGDVAATGGNQ